MNCFLRTFDEAGTFVAEVAVTGAIDCDPGGVARAVGWLDPSAAALYVMPTAAELAAGWMAGFSLPVTLYLAAYAVGQLVRFWDK